jgi:hypothetical protein
MPETLDQIAADQDPTLPQPEGEPPLWVQLLQTLLATTTDGTKRLLQQLLDTLPEPEADPNDSDPTSD